MGGLLMYAVISDSPEGTCLKGYFSATYPELVVALGSPNGAGDGGKVSTEWVLRGDDGTLWTLYDYKETSKYAAGLPTPEQFRMKASLEPYEWHIGGRANVNRDDCLQFIDWLHAQVRRARATLNQEPRKWQIF